MKIYEIMHLAKQTLNLLHASCIKMDDVRYLPLFDEFLKLKADGAKTENIVTSSPSKAEEYISRLEAIKWTNYLTQREAEAVVAAMNPPAPWSRDVWRSAMEQHGFPLEKEPCYNSCALWVTMNMIMSDSATTLERYIDSAEMLEVVHALAVDKLTDKDNRFRIRQYFNL